MPAPILIPENADLVWPNPGTSVDNFTATAAIVKNEPVILDLTAGTGKVKPADGSSATDVVFAGVALTSAAIGEQVTVITRGTATVAKDTGTAWASGDMIGIGAAKTATVYAPDLDGATAAKQTLGFCLAPALSGATTGLIYVNALGV